MGAGGEELDDLIKVLVAIRDDEPLRLSVLVFCNLPRLERMLRFNQFKALNQMDESSAILRVYGMLLHDDVARFAVHYLTGQ